MSVVEGVGFAVLMICRRNNNRIEESAFIGASHEASGESRQKRSITMYQFTAEDRRKGGLARAAQESFAGIAALGGKAVFEKYGPEHMRAIGKKGLRSLADKRFGGDVKAALVWLVQQGLKSQDPCPENGAWQNFTF